MMAKIDADELEIMEVVPQSFLVEYLRLQNRIEFLKASIRTSLEQGATVEKGDVTAKLVTSSRQSPKWKEVLTDLLGKDKVAEIVAGTPKTEVTSLKVEVKKQAMIKKDELT
jgi:hypothetical protein